MRSAMRIGAIMALLVVVLAGGQAAAVDAYPVNPANGHLYGLFFDYAISWSDANAAAGAVVLDGCYEGHLAAVTSAGENAFLVGQFGYGFTEVWLGGYQEEGVWPPDYGWQWVTGEPWAYTNWNAGEPNDIFGPASEQHLGLWGDGSWNDEGNLFNIDGYIVECDYVLVQIDIKPGSYPNSLNLGAKGVVPVAVLTTEDFDASTVDPATVQFAGAYPVHWAMEDVDLDGDMDLILHFKVQDLNLNASSTEATLTGRTFAGVAIQGTDTVNIVP